ncbi:hypothetical protein J057_13857 [Marinobacter nanhaiticus D15-8W]|uniref:DUF6160 domain-containing protein n=1 Tax=Marinobacter nanhaiticus D15-8W TaxID=626887 RepID=N6WU03_9GAMM|nr:DUF6160 family protein [Marinobacter nanhaiticus]ENO14527.2 hypothetical protein J057_13857 [Marinobacter nanhaiticus D15-8W]
MKHPLVFAFAACGSVAMADLQSLDDSDMAGISAQSGITMELDLEATVGRISYFDDGSGIHLDGFRIGSATDPEGEARHVIKLDILADASLNLDFLVEDRRLEFADVRLDGSPDVSMGGVFLDQNMSGSLNIAPGGALGPEGYTFNVAYEMTDGRLGYRTNGNEVFLDGVSMAVNAPGITLDVVGSVLELRSPSVTGSYSVDAIRFSGNPANHGVSVDATSGELLASYGSLSSDFDISSLTKIAAGGRFGDEGLRIDSETTINSATFIYRDDGNPIALRGISGSSTVNNLRLDVAPDWDDRQGLALTVDSIAGDLNIDRIEMGANGKNLGQVSLGYLFADQTIDGQIYTNALYLQGGGHADAGPQGLRLAAQWSLADADIAYTEDGNRVIFSGLQSWGQGDLTVNVTREEVLGGTQFYDGLRLGFEGVKGGYRLNGLRVGDEDSPLQGGTELLLALGFFPSYEFEIDGHITLGAGGAEGEGLTINSDMQIRNGRAAIIAAPYDEGAGEVPQKGLWATELDYDTHVRDMTIDVTEDGLAIIKGEVWGTMDMGNLRIGNKTGESFGRFVVQNYEKGSSMTITPGGAGNVCVGGSGADASACTASGGMWEMRGEEGVTIAMKKILARAISETKRNAFIWETNRTIGANGAENGTGTQLVLNDIYTSDGVDANGDGVEDNTFGIQTDLSVDIYQTKVVKKDDGADSNGIVGDRGDEKIMDASAPLGYRYVAAPSESERANRPLGFAVQAHSRFMELSINNIDLVHPTGGAATAVYGVKMQNFDIEANLTATPIQ